MRVVVCSVRVSIGTTKEEAFRDRGGGRMCTALRTIELRIECFVDEYECLSPCDHFECIYMVLR